MDGKNYLGANFAAGFRRALMGEHLGISPEDPILDDPVSNSLFNFMKKRANTNTLVYRNIFGCYPDDTYTSFEKLKYAQNKKQQEEPKIFLNYYNNAKDQIKGHIVEYPLSFLKDEELGTIFFSSESPVSILRSCLSFKSRHLFHLILFKSIFNLKLVTKANLVKLNKNDVFS